MKTLTEKEFRDKYGVMGEMKFQDPKREEGVFSQIKEAASAGVSKIGAGFEQAKTGKSPIDAIESGLKVGAGAVETAFSPLAPVLAPIGKGINAVADKISDSPMVQKFADSKAGQTTARVAEDVVDATTIAGAVVGGKGAPRVAGDIASGVAKGAGDIAGAIPKPNLGAVGKTVAGAVRDVIPTRQNLIDTQIAKALDLTPQDLVKLEPRSGQSLTEWMSENNLIGKNKVETENLVRGFFDTNYKAVREEIGKVTKEYKKTEIPRFYDALKQIKSQVDEVPGLEKVAVEVENLMNKQKPVLADVQKAKELLDDHFSLYKITGDVKEGAVKEGIATMRRELQKFIEDEVSANSKADIRGMNANVSSSRGLMDAIDKRSTRGVTRSMLSLRDVAIGLGLGAGVGPFVGIAYVFMQKLAESPSARLRFARYLDSIGDKQKKAVNDALLRGEVPPEAEAVIKSP